MTFTGQCLLLRDFRYLHRNTSFLDYSFPWHRVRPADQVFYFKGSFKGAVESVSASKRLVKGASSFCLCIARSHSLLPVQWTLQTHTQMSPSFFFRRSSRYCRAARAALAPSPEAIMILFPKAFVMSPAAYIPGWEVEQSG